jgi:hypothetical protein
MRKSLGANAVLGFSWTDHRAERYHERSLCSTSSHNRPPLTFLLLVLVLVEPLMCVAYCQSWTHLWLNRIGAAQHKPNELQLPNSIADELPLLPSASLSNLFICIMPTRHDAPTPAALAPTLLDAYRAAATVSIFVALILILQLHLVTSSLPLPYRSYRPLLRPPIATVT